MEGARVVLTSDCTLMSSYNGSQFIGFAACFPRVLPKWLYARLFCPPQRTTDGVALAAPAGLRRIEASLVNAGISRNDVVIANPEQLDRVVGDNTAVIGIGTSDPMGLGPASSTFSSLLKKETYTRYYFRRLLNNPAIRSSRAKVIVGGSGAWQLLDEEELATLGIDCLVEGEGDEVVPEVVGNILAGRHTPRIVSGGPVPVDRIPHILAPTINGTVEISRGCGRGCEFCNPNIRQVRHLSKDRILSEVRMNLKHSDKITLHAEDVLRYKAKGIVPNREGVTDLFSEVAKLTDNIGISHIALSSALSEPRLIEELAHITGTGSGGRFLYAQTGIETGSPEMVSRHMKGKAKPFSPEKWPEVVKEAIGFLADNNWTVCGTLVMGMPGEKREDILKTIELIQDLRDEKCLIVPLFFVPLGEMTDEGFFRAEDMLPEHWMLLSECLEHDFEWVNVLMDELFAQNRMNGTKARLLRLAAWYMKRRVRPYMDAMREGRNPLTDAHDEGIESESLGRKAEA